MKTARSFAVTLVAGLLTVGATAFADNAATTASLRSGLDLAGFDFSVRPQDDLFRFAGGSWLAKTEIPADRSDYGTFTKLQDDAQASLRRLAEAAAARTDKTPGSDEQKLGDLYAAWMDTARIESLGLAPLAADFARIESLASTAEVYRFMAEAQRLGIGAPLGAFVGQDRKQSTRYLAALGQSGLTLPDREYYVTDDARYLVLREQLGAYAERLFVLSGVPAERAKADAAQIVKLETAFAQKHWTRVENRDPVKTYNLTSLEAARAQMPAFDWTSFLAGFGEKGVMIKEFDIRQPSYVAALAGIINDTPVETWRAYFRFRLLDASAAYLPEAFDTARFEFRERAVRGVQEQQPRWRRGVSLIDRTLGEVAGRLYVEQNFKPEARVRIRELVDNLRQAFDVSIDSLEWMSADTKIEAKRKLASFNVKVGYPDKWRDYSALEIRSGDLLGNLRRVAEFENARQLDRLGGPVDRDEWFMTPQTVNAYYSPPMNEIVFPAAILQWPFFDPEADDAVNYGGIGGVIGHEFSHGFDDSGRRYDGQGNLRDWWTFEDNVRFRERAGKLAAQYSQYKPIDGKAINGDFTLGENIGDLSGLAVAYRAYQLSLGGREAPVIDGFTGPQRFFLGWAQIWRRKYRDDELRTRLVTDPHSPSEFRANGAVTNMTEFYEAFSLTTGDKLYREPAERVKIW